MDEIQMNPELNNTKLEEYVRWMNNFQKTFVDFHPNSFSFCNGFKPCHGNLSNIEDGTYVTLRCGLGGIYSCINFFKDGKWMAEALDNSTTIAYRPLKSFETFEYGQGAE